MAISAAPPLRRPSLPQIIATPAHHPLVCLNSANMCIPGAYGLKSPLLRCRAYNGGIRAPTFHAAIGPQSTSVVDAGAYRLESSLWRRSFRFVRPPTRHSAIRSYSAGMVSRGAYGPKNSGRRCCCGTPTSHSAIRTYSAGMDNTGAYGLESPFRRGGLSMFAVTPASHGAARPHAATIIPPGTYGPKGSFWRQIVSGFAVTPTPTNYSAILSDPASVTGSKAYGLEFIARWKGLPQTVTAPADHSAVRPHSAGEFITGTNRFVGVVCSIARRTLPITVAAAATDLPLLVHPAGMRIAGTDAGYGNIGGVVALDVTPAVCFAVVSYSAGKPFACADVDKPPTRIG